MNWKRLLYFDLRRLRPGSPPARDEQADQRFWIQRAIARRRTARATMQNPGYTPSGYYRALLWRSTWRGPRYWRPARHSAHLVTVLSELNAIVRANVPLSPALACCAHEQQRVFGAGGNTLRRAARALSLGLLVASPFAVLGASTPGLAPVAGVIGAIGALFITLSSLRAGQRIEAVCLVLGDRIAAGRTLSGAMRTMPRFFPAQYTEIVAAGEDSGKLAQTLDGLARHAIEQRELQRNLGGTLLYLGLLLLAHLVVGSFIVIKVLPIFSDILHDFGRTENPFRESVLTQAVHVYGEFVYMQNLSPQVAISLRVAAYALIAIVLAAVLIQFLPRGGPPRQPRSAPLRVRAAFLLPGLRGAITSLHCAWACGVLQLLVGAGVPLPEALGRAANLRILPRFQRGFIRLRKRLEQGGGLAEALREERYLPASFVHAASLGEASGRLAESFAFLEELYTLRARMRLRAASDLVLPVGVLAVGSCTLFIEWLSMGTLVDLVEACIKLTY